MFFKKKKKPFFFSQRRRQSKYTERGNLFSNYYSFSKKFSILFSTQHGVLTKQEIESARRTIRKHTGRKTRVYVLSPAFMPITKKPKQSRMGKGKGKIYNLISYVYPGKPLFAIRSKNLKSTRRSLYTAKIKLSVCTAVRSRSKI
jgi:large subunit ribosomal protein L16